MAATGRPPRRRTRLLLLRTLRVCRRHYGSLITLTALAVALSIALTSPSFSSGRSEEEEDVAASEPALTSADRLRLTQGFGRAVPPVAVPRVTYYLYDDEEERDLLTSILRRDYTDMTRKGLPNYIGEVHFLPVTTEAEEDYASFLVSEIVAWAKTDGVTVNVVDLR
jgi:hypothetical protein